MNLDTLKATIEQLESEKEQLYKKALAPEGAWLQDYTKTRLYPSGFVGVYQYVKWQASEPIFERKPKQKAKKAREKEQGKKHPPIRDQHIGRVWSNTGLGTDPEVIDAYYALARRHRIEAIELAIERLSAAIDSLEKLAARFDDKLLNRPHDKKEELDFIFKMQPEAPDVPGDINLNLPYDNVSI